MRQRRWVELLNDYDCEIRYHPGKANVVADALSRKERVKTLRVRALGMTIHTSLTTPIRNAQQEALKVENLKGENLRGMDKKLEPKSDETLYFSNTIWVPQTGGLRELVLNEAHKSKYSIHPGSDKMYKNLKEFYWWPNMKGDIAIYVDMLHACVMDFGGNWDNHLPLAEFSYNNSYHTSIKAAPFEALYGRKCRSPLCWAEVGEKYITGPEIIQETTDRLFQIRDRIKAARDRQKSYSDNRRKPLEFNVGDKVLLKVSPWKGVARFGKRGKLNPMYIKPFEILDKIGPLAYKLKLPQELSGIHETFHVSNMKKCLADETLIIPPDDIRVDHKLHFVEEPLSIEDWKIQKLRRNCIKLVKVHWNSKRSPDFTWEREDQMKKKYPSLFEKTLIQDDMNQISGRNSSIVGRM
ncbi:uncharacterized protein LOC143582092 [Bidens hawaiensis]|uniref:uncharacterized protein LOC143582092 n=1 Tax=Bidens hawaiensis TaxID=980011 RepID=UPI00404ABA93